MLLNDKRLEELCLSLGIPAAVFRGEEHASTLVHLAYRKHDSQRLSKLRDTVGKAVVTPFLEKAFPEMFWEPLFLCSPRGRMMVRRKTPVTVTY